MMTALWNQVLYAVLLPESCERREQGHGVLTEFSPCFTLPGGGGEIKALPKQDRAETPRGFHQGSGHCPFEP
jgi:hypothetical protein